MVEETFRIHTRSDRRLHKAQSAEMGSEQSHPLRHGGSMAGQFSVTPEELARSNFHKGNHRFKECDYRGAILQYVSEFKFYSHDIAQMVSYIQFSNPTAACDRQIEDGGPPQTLPPLNCTFEHWLSGIRRGKI